MIQANPCHVSLLFSKFCANRTRLQLKRQRNEEPPASICALYNVFFCISYRPKDGRWRKHATGSGTGSINVINDYQFLKKSFYWLSWDLKRQEIPSKESWTLLWEGSAFYFPSFTDIKALCGGGEWGCGVGGEAGLLQLWAMITREELVRRERGQPCRKWGSV